MKYKIKLILGFFLILILFVSCSSKRKRSIQNIDPDKEFKPLSISSTKSNLSVTRTVDNFLLITDTLSEGRYSHTATLLNNSNVLIVGGNGSTGYLSSAEVYNPIAEEFSNTGPLNHKRGFHTATLLNGGNVLIVGGYGVTGYLSSAEVYNPTTGESYTEFLNHKRGLHTATLLNGGNVLIVGGRAGSGIFLSSAEIYNPTTGATGEFTYTGSLKEIRFEHTATLLNDGNVLIVGGRAGSSIFLSSAEIYNPTTEEFTYTGSLNHERFGHTATLLNDGKVLIVGGYGGASAEVYDPSTGKFTYTGSLNEIRSNNHTATLLNDGHVLIVGGYDGASAEVYDPATGKFISTTGSLNEIRPNNHTATLLNEGKVLIVAGYGLYGASAEVFTPSLPIGGDLTCTFIAPGGTPPYTYSVVSGGGTIAPSGEFSADNIYQSSTVTVKVTDALEDTATTTISVDVTFIN